MIWFLAGVVCGYIAYRLLARFGVLCRLSHHHYKFDLIGIAHCRRCGHTAIEGFGPIKLTRAQKRAAR